MANPSQNWENVQKMSVIWYLPSVALGQLLEESAQHGTLVASQSANTMQVVSGAARLGQNEGTNAAGNQNDS